MKRAGTLTDFPTLGVDQNGIYVSAFQISSDGVSVASNIVVAFKKPEIYQGTNLSVTLNVTTNDLPADVIQPAVNFDASPRGGYAWFVGKQKRVPATPYAGGAIAYRRLQWSGTNAAWVDANWVSLTNTFYRNYFDLDEGGISAPQSNTTQRIDLQKIGSRLMTAVIRAGALWTCQHIGLSGTNGTYASGQSVDRSGAQWLKLSTDTNGNFLSLTNGRVYDAASADPRYYYFPSLMVNRAGDMAMGFSGSKSNEFIGAFYSYRAADGTTPSQALLMHPGQGIFDHSSRWGDYSATTLDPLDGLSFWTVQQYAQDDPLDNLWGTWISEIVPNTLGP